MDVKRNGKKATREARSKEQGVAEGRDRIEEGRRSRSNRKSKSKSV